MFLITVIAILIGVIKYHPNTVNVGLFKKIVAILIGFGGFWHILYSNRWYKEVSPVVLLLIIVLWIAAFIAAIIWGMMDMSADEIKEDYKNSMLLFKRCPSCTKKLPSYLTKKCPHCTADL